MRFLVLLLSLVAIQAQAPAPDQPDIYGLINILYIKADINADGIITQDELRDVFEGFDKNKDGRVTNAEFVELWKLVTSQTDALANAYFSLADLNDDNIIDKQDYPIVYQLFDLNHDDKVTAQEFVSKWEDIIRETPFVVLFERADSNNDEMLSKQEFDGFFSSFDNNNDGKVDLREFKEGWSHADFALQSDANSLFHEVDADNNDYIEAGSDFTRLFQRYDANSDGSLSLQETIQFRLFVFVIIAVLNARCDESQPVDELFMKEDTNSDDQLTRVEFYSLIFLFDTNSDSSISPTEFVNAWTTEYHLGSEDEAQALFTRTDTNDDGYITPEDIPGIFSYFDTNGDGLVDISEFLTEWGSLKSESTDDLNETIDITG